MKKNAAIIYGLLYCEGYDWLKVRIFFNLFKDKDRKLKKSEDLDYFLFMLFTTATYWHVMLEINYQNIKKLVR